MLRVLLSCEFITLSSTPNATILLTHQKYRGNNQIPSRRSPPNRLLRSRLPRHRPPHLRSRHNSLRLPPRNLRNEKTKRLSQSRLPQRDLHRSLLPDLQPGHLPLVRRVDCLAGTGECRTDGEASCVWGCASGAYCERVFVCGCEVPARADFAAFEAFAGEYSDALGYLAGLYDWLISYRFHPS